MFFLGGRWVRECYQIISDPSPIFALISKFKSSKYTFFLFVCFVQPNFSVSSGFPIDTDRCSKVDFSFFEITKLPLATWSSNREVFWTNDYKNSNRFWIRSRFDSDIQIWFLQMDQFDSAEVQKITEIGSFLCFVVKCKVFCFPLQITKEWFLYEEKRVYSKKKLE